MLTAGELMVVVADDDRHVALSTTWDALRDQGLTEAEAAATISELLMARMSA